MPRNYEDNQETDVLVTGIFNCVLDEDAREIDIVDGKRVIVYDMDTGDYKLGWGGRGMPVFVV